MRKIIISDTVGSFVDKRHKNMYKLNKLSFSVSLSIIRMAYSPLACACARVLIDCLIIELDYYS